MISLHRENELAKRLATIPGIGVITVGATAAKVSDPGQFRSGRQFAAWLVRIATGRRRQSLCGALRDAAGATGAGRLRSVPGPVCQRARKINSIPEKGSSLSSRSTSEARPTIPLPEVYGLRRDQHFERSRRDDHALTCTASSTRSI